MALSFSEPGDSQELSHSDRPRAEPPDLETLMSSSPFWPLGSAIYRLLNRKIPSSSSGTTDQAGKGPSGPALEPQQSGVSLDPSPAKSPDTHDTVPPALAPADEVPVTPFTPKLAGSFSLVSSKDSASEPRSLHTDSSPNPPTNLSQVPEYRIKGQSLSSPSEPSGSSLMRGSVRRDESPGGQDSHSYDESLDGTPIKQNGKSTRKKADPPQPICQTPVPKKQQAQARIEDTIDPDLDGLPMFAERNERDLNKKRVRNSDELLVTDSKRRKIPSSEMTHRHSWHVSTKEERHSENQIVKKVIPENESSLTAWLDSCIAPIDPSPPSATLCATDINIPQLLEAIRDAKASSSRLRSEGFVGDEIELQPKPVRKHKGPIQHVHKDRLALCSKWPKGESLDASSSKDENIEGSRTRMSQNFDPSDPFPLDSYIVLVIKKIVSQFWNQYIVEAFCRVGLWLERQGVWEHGNWGTLLSNELARFIDIGGKGRLADMLAYHRPKPFEDILLISSQMHLLELSRDSGLMRVRLNKDFTPRGLFYRPLIRGLRLWTYEERTPVADRNRLEYEYISRFTDSGDIAELLPPHTTFRKYTHWAATENVIVMVIKDKPKVTAKEKKDKLKWNAKDQEDKLREEAKDKYNKGGAKELKLTTAWISREYKNEPAPTCKLECGLLKQIEDLITKAAPLNSIEPKKPLRRWGEARPSI